MKQLSLPPAFVLLAGLVGLGALGCPATPPAPTPVTPLPVATTATPTASPEAELPLHFRGSWRDPVEQVVFAFDLRLERTGATTVKGRILWTLMATPPGHGLADRVNEVGTEYVTGTWDPKERVLALRGTSVDSSLLVTDQYKLTVAADGKGFVGKTRGSAGTWANDIDGERAEP